MKIPTLFLFLLLIIFLAFTGCIDTDETNHNENSFKVHEKILIINDSFGDKVLIPAVKIRVICQNGMACELLTNIGAADLIVGVSEATAEEKVIMNLIPHAENIGNSYTPSIEKIISLHPDIVISYSRTKEKYHSLYEDLNIPVLYLDCFKIQNLSNESRTLGIVTGKYEKSERYAKFLEKYINLVKQRTQNIINIEQPRIYCEAGTDYYALGSGSYGEYYATLLNGIYVGRNLSQDGLVTPEWILKENPDVFIKLLNRGGDVKSNYEKILNRTELFDTNAFKNRRIYVINTGQSPKAMVGLVYLAKMIYPDLFRDINPKSILIQYASEFLPGADNEITFYPSPSTS